VDEIKDCSHTSNENELGDGKVPTGERPLIQSRTKHGVASKHQPMGSPWRSQRYRTLTLIEDCNI
jgi:hypothetical protein